MSFNESRSRFCYRRSVSTPTHEPGSTREPEPVYEVQNELEEGESDEEAEGAADGGEDPAEVEHLVLCVHRDVAALDLGGEPAETWVAVQQDSSGLQSAPKP